MNIRFAIAFLLIIGYFFTGCGQNDDQRDFENEAFSLDEQFTETEAGSGEVTSEDPDDWRTAPFFQGLVTVDPAFPNPVATSNQLNIEVHITGLDAVSGLVVWAYYENGGIKTLYSSTQNPVPPGLTSIPINPVELGQFNTPESARGIKRIILIDNQENIISYGDVMVE